MCKLWSTGNSNSPILPTSYWLLTTHCSIPRYPLLTTNCWLLTTNYCLLTTYSIKFHQMVIIVNIWPLHWDIKGDISNLCNMICGYAWIIQSIPPNLKYGSSLPWLCFSDAFMVQPIAGWTQNDKTKMAQKGDQWIEMVTEMAHPLGAECCFISNSHRSSMPQLVAFMTFLWLFPVRPLRKWGKKHPFLLLISTADATLWLILFSFI